MRFDDDYLWDGSGEPDPDVRRLEGLLAGYRHTAPAPEVDLPKAAPARSRFPAPALLAAAAVLVTALAAGVAWRVVSPGEVETSATHTSAPPAVDRSLSGTPVAPSPIVEPPRPIPDMETVVPAVLESKRPKPRHLPSRHVGTQRAPSDATMGVVVAATPDEPGPRGDVDASAHFERAAVLLRSFENARAAEGEAVVDVSYERERSRALLAENRTLRQSAAERGDLVTEDALAGLEPYLVEISNLDPSAKTDEVAPIQQRLEHRGLDSELQLYATNRRGTGF